MSFEKYLKEELNRPSTNPYYDPNGNSARAVLTRGLIGEIVCKFKDYPRRVRYELSCFDGLNTPVGWFIQLPIMFVAAPILPITAGVYWYKRSVREFKAEYEASLGK